MDRLCREARITVRYAETDQMGVAYYSNYLIWMEVGRVEYCRALGLRYRDMEEQDDILLAVVEAHCRYLRAARYDDEVLIKTWISAATSRAVTFGYEFSLAADGQKLAAGETRHIFCNRGMRPVRLPEKYRPLFGIPQSRSKSS